MDRFFQILLIVASIYALFGILFGVAFVLRGVARIDQAAQGSPWGFRLLVLPGVAALWPLLLRDWLAAPPARKEADQA